MTWTKVSMPEAIIFMQDKKLDYSKKHHNNTPDGEASVVYFTDGTAVAVKSDWREPFSIGTPDIDANPPIWWIGVSNE